MTELILTLHLVQAASVTRSSRCSFVGEDDVKTVSQVESATALPVLNQSMHVLLEIASK
jgi:hypothetical protein